MTDARIDRAVELTLGLVEGELARRRHVKTERATAALAELRLALRDLELDAGPSAGSYAARNLEQMSDRLLLQLERLVEVHTAGDR